MLRRVSRLVAAAIVIAAAAPAIEIWQIQGAGTASPYAGQSVTAAATPLRAADHDGMVLFLSTVPLHRPRRVLHAAH